MLELIVALVVSSVLYWPFVVCMQGMRWEMKATIGLMTYGSAIFTALVILIFRIHPV